jgi:DNA-binding XRE family transcriptional regulator
MKMAPEIRRRLPGKMMSDGPPTLSTEMWMDRQLKTKVAKSALKSVRESLLMSKAELAREANVSPITITRIEQGKPCRMETKRKILLALGYNLADAKKIFGE